MVKIVKTNKGPALELTSLEKVVGCVILLTGIFLIFYFGLRYDKNKLHSFNKHRKMVIGKVISINLVGARPSYYSYVYTFFAAQITHSGHFSTSFAVDRLVGLNFPVLYDSTKPEVNEMLIFPNDYKENNLPFPDSLDWVREFH